MNPQEVENGLTRRFADFPRPSAEDVVEFSQAWDILEREHVVEKDIIACDAGRFQRVCESWEI